MYLYVNHLLKYMIIKTDLDINVLSSIARFQKHLNDLILTNRFIEIEQKLNSMFETKLESLNSQYRHLFEIQIDDIESLQIVFDKFTKDEILYGSFLNNQDEFTLQKMGLIEILDTIILDKSIKSNLDMILSFEIDTWVSGFFESNYDFVNLYYSIRFVKINRYSNVYNDCLGSESYIPVKLQLPFSVDSGLCICNLGISTVRIDFKRNLPLRGKSKSIELKARTRIYLKSNRMCLPGYDYLLINSTNLNVKYSWMILEVEF